MNGSKEILVRRAVQAFQGLSGERQLEVVFKFIFTFYFWFAGAARLPACSAELEAGFQLGSPGFPQPCTWCSSSSSCSTRWSPVSPPGNGFGGENPDREIQAALSVDDQQPKCLAGGVQDEMDLQGAFLAEASHVYIHSRFAMLPKWRCCSSLVATSVSVNPAPRLSLSNARRSHYCKMSQV